MRDQEKIEARILDICGQVQSDMDLEWFTIHHKFTTSTPDETERLLAKTITEWEYRQASILWNLGLAAAQTDDELRDVAIHEHVHILLSPLWDDLPDKFEETLGKHNEFVTENIARAIATALETPPR